jgi:hypothetical protein
MSNKKLRCERFVKTLKGRERCSGTGVEYEVTGASYTTHAVLCERHAEAARKEGFKLKAAA